MITRKATALSLGLILTAPALPAQAAKGFPMGYGASSCGEVIEAVKSGDKAQIGQIAGWILGYWSAISFQRDQAFIDKLKQAGAQRVVEITLQQCEQADPATPLVAVTHQTIQGVN